MTQAERVRIARARPKITRELMKLERLYGEVAVASAFDRHRQVRRERRRLDRVRREISAKIRRLQ